MSSCPCPHCGDLLAEYDSITPADIVICGECISVLVFDQQRRPRVAGPDDYLAMSDDVRRLTRWVSGQAILQRQLERRVEKHRLN